MPTYIAKYFTIIDREPKKGYVSFYCESDQEVEILAEAKIAASDEENTIPSEINIISLSVK
ncbi:hypothetical protein BEP19_04770 [Ammoniphilus oxalaticus]|uniref:Uncharacterized protein n=1 Tax=Ammoniphilus oxalaticus TaxID=66863 RepID=A0A419SM21_9BACL|nr:hypothetical protein [Ammoniphilus oxalaticus]RKD25133.1 hypothetical protein BEP19_04770 [Ammoniphilus oxalaticus]